MNWLDLSLIIIVSAVAGGLAYGLVIRLFARQPGWIARSSQVVSPRWATRLLVALVSAYVLVFGAMSILSYLSFNITGYDLSIFDQVVWNSLHGRLFENKILTDAPLLIGQRFSPILLAFVPFYAVWSSPIVLMAVQTLGLGVAAFPLYWMARQRIGRLLSLVIVAAYLMFPSLAYVNLFEFHEIALSVPLLAFATFFLVRRKYVPLLVCLGLSLLIKEEMAFIASAFGLYILLVQRQFKLGLGMIIFGTMWAWLLLEYILPFFRGAEGYYYFSHGQAGGAFDRYGYLGTSLSEIVITLITRPLVVLRHVLIVPKIEFVLLLLVPLAFIPLLTPEMMLLTLPTFGLSLLSDLDLIYSIKLHYTASLLPFLFSAAAVGVERILRWRRPSEMDRQARGVAVGALMLTASLLSYYSQSPGPLAQNFDPARYVLNAHTAAGHTLLQAIPDDAIVVAQTSLLPHVTDRRTVFEFTGLPFPWQAEYLVADTTSVGYQRFKPTWDRWLNSGYFHTVAQPDGYLLAKRTVPAQQLRIGFGNELLLVRAAAVTSQTPRGGEPIYIPVEWYALRNITTRYSIEVHLIDGQGHVVASDDREPCYAFCPTNKWNFDQFIDDYYVLSVPPTAAAGNYTITMAVYDQSNDRYVNATDATSNPLGDNFVIAQFHVEKDKSSVTASQLQIEQPLYVDMGEMRFLGFIPPRQTIAAGELLQLGLYWRARSKPRGDYGVTVQLRDAMGRVAFEQSSRPANNTYPTTNWDEGEVLLDWHDFNLPSSMPSGSYEIQVILRDSPNWVELGRARIGMITVN